MGRFDILHALRIKGLARPAVLGELAGIPEAEVEAACAPLVDEGLVLFRGGPMAGYLPTPAGRKEAERLLAEDPATSAGRDALADFDAWFLPINAAFKHICHRWQVRPGDLPNDHSDAGYDQGVVDELAALHQQIQPELERLAGPLPRFGRYEPRLTAALGRVQGGDSASFARPMYDSYHDIWMELHNDVVLSLGRSRSAADEH